LLYEILHDMQIIEYNARLIRVQVARRDIVGGHGILHHDNTLQYL